MSRCSSDLFAIVCYAIFFATFLYLIVFVGDSPCGGDGGQWRTAISAAIATVIDVALIALFGLQHSVMALPAFQARWTQIVPPATTQYLRPCGQSRADDSIPDGGRSTDRLERNQPYPSGHHVAAILDRMGDNAGHHVPDQSFRAFRTAAGLAGRAGAGAEKPELRHPISIAGSRIRSTAAFSWPSGQPPR